MRLNLAALDVFTIVMKMKNPTGLWDVKLAWYSPSVWNTTFEFTVLGLPDLAWLLIFLQPEWNFLNHLVTDQLHLHLLYNKCFWFLPQYYGSVKLIKHKFLNWLLCEFIWVAFKSHGLKKCMCQCTNYFNTTNNSG